MENTIREFHARGMTTTSRDFLSRKLLRQLRRTNNCLIASRRRKTFRSFEHLCNFERDNGDAGGTEIKISRNEEIVGMFAQNSTKFRRASFNGLEERRVVRAKEQGAQRARSTKRYAMPRDRNEAGICSACE